jgi:diguanylate cyclase (GGDEF)-like protein
MPTSPAPASIFTPEYVRSLVQVFRRICPAMAVTEVVRTALVWQAHPLDAALNAAFAGVFLLITLGLWRGRRPLRVIRLGFLGAALVALSFDLFAYALLPPEVTPQNAAYALAGRYMYLPYVMMLLSWLLFPTPWAGRLALGVYLSSLGLGLLASLHALAQGRVTGEGLLNFSLHQVLVGGSFYLLLQVFMAVYARQARIERERAQFRQDALHDALTGLSNRRAFDEALARETAQAHRSGQPLSLVAFDLDHFKQVNDTHGHDLGDQVLVELAGLVRGLSRAGDLPARWGGEEFTWLLPGVDQATAPQLAERLRAAVAAHPFPGGPLTISLGTATLRSGEEGSSLFTRADTALYAAKRAGRNRVGMVDDLPPVA